MIPDRKYVSRDGPAVGLMELAEILESGTVDPRMVQHDYLTEQSPIDVPMLSHPSRLYHSIVQVSQDVLPPTEPQRYPCSQFQNHIHMPMDPPEEPECSDEEYEDFGNMRPQCSYIDMIRRALKSSGEGKMKLKDIYEWITTNYPYFATCRLQWKNSVRHALSASKEFARISAGPEWTRGGEWALASTAEKEKPSTIFVNPPATGIPMSWFKKMSQDLDEVSYVTYVYSDTFAHFVADADSPNPDLLVHFEAKSPTPDPFATVEDDCFSQAPSHDDKENTSPANYMLDMPDLDMDTNLNELVFDGQLVTRKR